MVCDTTDWHDCLREAEQQPINSGVKAEASLGGLHSSMTGDCTAAPFSSVSCITITLDLSPSWHRAWSSPFLCSRGTEVSRWQGKELFSPTASLTGTTLMALLTAPAAQRSRSVGVLMGGVHCLDVFLKHQPEQHQIPLCHTKGCATSKAAASSGRGKSVYYRFLRIRCDGEYKHIWHRILHTGGISLPQGYLCLCCFILAASMTQSYP